MKNKLKLTKLSKEVLEERELKSIKGGYEQAICGGCLYSCIVSDPRRAECKVPVHEFKSAQ
jgi:natural product precursor